MVAFWLWWPLIIAQALLVVLIFIGCVILVVRVVTIRGTGPAEGYTMIFLVPIGIVVTALLVAEVLLIFRLRRGSRAVRPWLLALAILTALAAALLLIAVINLEGLFHSPGYELYAAGGILLTSIFVPVVALALVGGVMPFGEDSNQLHTKPYEASAPPPESSIASTTERSS